MPMPYYQPSPMQTTFMPFQQNPMQYQPQTQYQMPSQPQTIGLSGRTVNSFAEITANDVPMTGGFAVFPKADLSEIEVRQWNANGTISTRTFKPLLTDGGINPQASENNGSMAVENAHTQEILSRLENIEKMLAPKQTNKRSEEVAK